MALFGMFGRKGDSKPAAPLRATLVFDEAFCHSAGENPDARTYTIPRGTTEILFRFPDFDGFWQTYVNGNPHIPDESLAALRDGQAAFCFQVIENGVYMTETGVDDSGGALFNAETLIALDAPKPPGVFEKGAIGAGFYHFGKYRFEVLWATLYRAE